MTLEDPVRTLGEPLEEISIIMYALGGRLEHSWGALRNTIHIYIYIYIYTYICMAPGYPWGILGYI